jgi:hypothetical protein
VFHILHGSYYVFLFFAVLILLITSWIEIRVLFSKTLTDVETHRIMDYTTKDQQQSSYHVDPSESDTDSERADNEQSKRGTVVYDLRRTKEMKLLTKFSRYPIPFILSVVWWIVLDFCVAFYTKNEGTVGALDVVIEVSKILTPTQGEIAQKKLTNRILVICSLVTEYESFQENGEKDYNSEKE